MLALRELLLLLRGTWALWVGYLPSLGFWFCIGYATRLAALQAAVMLGTRETFSANLVFLVGLVAWVVCLVLMIASLGPGLRFDKGSDAAPPEGFRSGQSRQETVLHAVAPFLAVYALGGFAEEQVNDLQQTALVWLGLDYVTNQPVRFDLWQVYLAILVVAWLVHRLVGWLNERRPRMGLTFLEVAAKGTVVLTTFIVLTQLASMVTRWVTSRAFWGWLEDGWAGFLAFLPDWRLPFDLTLPEAVSQAAVWILGTVAPAAVASVLLPLTWLALTATIFGWRDLTHNAIGLSASEQYLVDRAERLGDTPAGRRLRGAIASGPVRFAWRQIAGLAEDYLPVAQGIRLIARAGSRFVAAYLVASALLTTTERLVRWGLERAWGPRGLDEILVAAPLFDVVPSLLFTTLAMALYAHAFDRALLASVAGPGLDPVSPGSRTPALAGPAAPSPAQD